MMRTTIVAILAIILVAGSAPSADKKEPAKGKDKASPTAKLMQEKLKHSQRLLEGLALADFAKITDGAEELMRISKATDWWALRTPEYELHTNQFRRAVEITIQKAKDKNIDGATLGYVDMTMTCVRCHQYTREQRQTRLPIPSADRVALGQ
jgi:hypothetical protein